ncbi:SLC5 family protein [Bacteroidota bacterium]
MGLNLDLIIFLVYIGIVLMTGILVSRKSKKSGDDYFLAGRNLTWWVIGGSLIAANISTHHFIGMSGQGFSIGLAIASFEWMAAIALIIYGKFFLPYYLKTKITTMPEFLERRFNHQVRLSFAIISLVGYIFIELAVVLYTGALALESIFGLPLYYGLVILFVVTGAYTIYGGLKSVVYTDIIQVFVLICGGLLVTFIGLAAVGKHSPEYSDSIFGGFKAILEGAPEKFRMVKAWDHPEVPWVGVFFGGVMLANVFYWGCNQFITQRTLAARSVWHGQMGVVFAGFLKLLVPVLVVLPGIICFFLYNAENGLMNSEYVLTKADLAFPTLVKNMLPTGLSGLVMAGLLGAVMSTIASLLTSSSSILVYDLYKARINPDVSPKIMVRIGRLTMLVILIIATIFGYFLRDLSGIFIYIQKYWSIAYPSIVAVFLGGFFYKRATSRGSLLAIIIGTSWAIMINVAELAEWIPLVPFLNRVIIDFLICAFIIWIFRQKSGPIKEKAIIDRSLSEEARAQIEMVPWYGKFELWSIILLLILAFLYIRFF